MPQDPDQAIRTTLLSLADQCGVHLEATDTAVATGSKSARVRMYDGSLEAIIIPTERGEVRVESPRALGISIELVDPTKDHFAPLGATYKITTYMNSKEPILVGDHIYVGKDGLITNRAR